jgi:multicomponent Na+:H+ antiporter subunit B
MSRTARLLVFLVAGAALAVLLGFALAGLPGYDAPLGDTARSIAATAVSDRTATNSVISVAFDYRALDTLGEEFMIFVAAIGAVVLLRTIRGDREDERAAKIEERRAPDTSDVLRVMGEWLAPITVVLGVYVVAHGQLTPGGGFQGGVVIAAMLVFVYTAGQHVVVRGLRPIELTEAAESIGAAGFALVGVGGLVFAAAFFENFIGTGTQGSLLSGGTIPLANLSVGLEVAGAFSLILADLLDQVVLRQRRAR